MKNQDIIVYFMFVVLSGLSIFVSLNQPELLKGLNAPILIAAPLLCALIYFFISKGEKTEVKKELDKKEKKPSKEISEKPSEVVVTQFSEDIDQKEIAIIQIMGLLQREGRFLDFISENIELYDDAQVGAAVRTLHKGCKTVVTETFGLKPVIGAQEGSEIEIDADYDPVSIKLMGKIKGKPPFKGFLIHPGWKLGNVKLANWTGKKTDIVFPAEIEIK